MGSSVQVVASPADCQQRCISANAIRSVVSQEAVFLNKLQMPTQCVCQTGAGTSSCSKELWSYGVLHSTCSSCKAKVQLQRCLCAPNTLAQAATGTSKLWMCETLRPCQPSRNRILQAVPSQYLITPRTEASNGILSLCPIYCQQPGTTRLAFMRPPWPMKQVMLAAMQHLLTTCL